MADNNQTYDLGSPAALAGGGFYASSFRRLQFLHACATTTPQRRFRLTFESLCQGSDPNVRTFPLRSMRFVDRLAADHSPQYPGAEDLLGGNFRDVPVEDHEIGPLSGNQLAFCCFRPLCVGCT